MKNAADLENHAFMISQSKKSVARGGGEVSANNHFIIQFDCWRFAFGFSGSPCVYIVVWHCPVLGFKPTKSIQNEFM